MDIRWSTGFIVFAEIDFACATLLLDSDANAEFLSQQVAITAVFVCPLAYP
jgi:hypothetical protein